VNAPPFAKGLARLLANEPDSRAGSVFNREATVAAMALRLRARRRRRVLRAWAGTAFATAAAAAALFVAVPRARHAAAPVVEASGKPPSGAAIIADEVSGGVLRVSNGHATPTVSGSALETGDHVLTLLDGRVTIALPTGTHLAVEGGADVAILSDGATQLFELASGGLRADVAKLKAGERFLIRTGDAEVEVRGTSFRVATVQPDPTCGHGAKTRVRVYEGVVTVRTSGADSVAVHPGESWPAGCDAPSPGAPPPQSKASERAPAASPVRPRPASSDLAAQNDLFDTAMQFERRGDFGAAVASFERLLERYPTCPLAEGATLERMKLLARYDHVRAVEAAREYLRRYPAGFGRAEAQAVAE
jgi:ferric-dicitrate binding protein FerR (iron transport regulator)